MSDALRVEIAAIRVQVEKLAADATLNLKTIQGVMDVAKSLHHDQQNLRGALKHILDHLDQIAPQTQDPGGSSE